MTTQTAIFDGLPTGLTLTGKVFDTDTPDTEVTGNSLAITEGTNAKGRYAVVNTRATALPAGNYDIRLFVGSVPIAVGRFTFAGTDGETAVETAVLAVLDSASVTAVQSGLATSSSQTTILNRLGAFTGTGINTVLGMFRALAAKATGLTPTDLSTGTTYDNTTDSLEKQAETGGSLTPEQEAKIDAIQDSIDAYITGVTASAQSPGSISSFPETLRVGDSYTDVLGRAIQLLIVDSAGSPLSSAGSKAFEDATLEFVIKRANDTEVTRIISGSATFIDPPGTGTGQAPYALIEIPSSETAKGLVKYRYTGLLTFTWPYVGTGTDSEVMTFETGTITFEA